MLKYTVQNIQRIYNEKRTLITKKNKISKKKIFNKIDNFDKNNFNKIDNSSIFIIRINSNN